MATAISANEVHVQLGSAHILLGISFELAEGRTLAVLGSNGSGKSTLVRALVGAIPISHGHVQLFGQSLKHRRRIDWARIGFAPQRATATSGVPATALETVMGGLIYGNRLLAPRGGRDKAMAARSTSWDWPTGRTNPYRPSPAGNNSGFSPPGPLCATRTW
ncbi:ATP-binding cassette domain-containing protein [Trueperella pyogenes]|uniref:ATP-binding cassette domain-containing protein n=1 Tax=Trueperella pyogenes TaxID=1661 RepID=UPI0032532B63